MYSFVRKPFWFVCLVCYCVRIWSWQIMNDSFYVIQVIYRDFRKYLVIDKKKKSLEKMREMMFISLARISFKK